MGDSLKWAADQAEEAYYASDDYKKRKAQAEEWNDLAEKAMDLPVEKLNIGDLKFLLDLETASVDFHGRRWDPKEERFERLRKLVAKPKSKKPK